MPQERGLSKHFAAGRSNVRRDGQTVVDAASMLAHFATRQVPNARRTLRSDADIIVVEMDAMSRGRIAEVICQREPSGTRKRPTSGLIHPSLHTIDDMAKIGPAREVVKSDGEPAMGALAGG